MLSRREVLGRGVSATAAAAAAARLAAGGAENPAPPSGLAFSHGVASGDPTPESVVLWTRVGGAVGTVTVRWTVARDEALADVVAQGDVTTDAGVDHTVHVVADGLDPSTWYFYAFDLVPAPEARSTDARSTVGRTRTARAADDLEAVRLGVVSCASFAAGPFTAYRRLAESDVDLVVHLGDYLYDVGDGPRHHDPPEAPVSLADYRSRHAQQRGDPDLQRLHATVPVAAIWDDHDVAGNAWRHGAAGHDPARHGSWEERRAAALKAWTEWLPVRLPDADRPERIWRHLPLGGVADLILLDTRHDARDEPVSGDDDGAALALASSDRQLISEDQRDWLTATLASSTTVWRVVGNQVVLTPLAFRLPDALASLAGGLGTTFDGKVVNPDAWDGYPAERDRVLAAMEGAGPVIVITGDVHSSWALEVAGPDGEPLAAEWVTPSVTAPPFADIVGIPSPTLASAAVDLIGGQVPEVRWAELTEHGFLVVALGSETAQCDWWHVALESGDPHIAASWSVTTTSSRMAEASPLAPRPPAPRITRPAPATRPSTTRPSTTASGTGSRTSGPPLGAVGGVSAVVAGAVAWAVAVRRRRS